MSHYVPNIDQLLLVIIINMYKKERGPVDLKDKICLVTGGSRGIGKGIAVQLAYHGATCYITGRNLETLEKLNKEVEESGGNGKCVPVQCDHANDDEVKKLFERIDEENNGKLDLLVNNVYTAVKDTFSNEKYNFWERPPDDYDDVNNVGLRNHYRCSVYAARLMVEKRQGLVINISSIGGMRYLFTAVYGIGKCANDRMAQDCAFELEKYNIAFISLCPGLVGTETVMESTDNIFQPIFGDFLHTLETPTYVGRTVVALLSEPHAEVMARSGHVVPTTDIGRKYAITDEKGITPNALMQLNVILHVNGYRRLAKIVPNFVRIPFWFARAMEVIKHS